MNVNELKLQEAQELQLKLMDKEKLSLSLAAILTDSALNRFDGRVLEGVRLWMKDQLTDDFEVEEISMADIQEETGLTGFQALCFLDIYLKNPEFAENDVMWFERMYG